MDRSTSTGAILPLQRSRLERDTRNSNYFPAPSDSGVSRRCLSKKELGIRSECYGRLETTVNRPIGWYGNNRWEETRTPHVGENKLVQMYERRLDLCDATMLLVARQLLPGAGRTLCGRPARVSKALVWAAFVAATFEMAR